MGLLLSLNQERTKPMTENNEEDFKLDLDNTCAAAAKRAKDSEELVGQHIKNFLEPIEETARCCEDDEEAFWLVMKNEHNYECVCSIIKRMAKELEGKLSEKELCFMLCYGIMRAKAHRLEGMIIADKIIKSLEGLK